MRRVMRGSAATAAAQRTQSNYRELARRRLSLLSSLRRFRALCASVLKAALHLLALPFFAFLFVSPCRYLHL